MNPNEDRIAELEGALRACLSDRARQRKVNHEDHQTNQAMLADAITRAEKAEQEANQLRFENDNLRNNYDLMEAGRAADKEWYWQEIKRFRNRDVTDDLASYGRGYRDALEPGEVDE